MMNETFHAENVDENFLEITAASNHEDAKREKNVAAL